MSEAGFSDSEKEEFELKVNDYVLSDKGNQVLYDDELKDFVAKIEQHGLYEKFKKLLKRKLIRPQRIQLRKMRSHWFIKY